MKGGRILFGIFAGTAVGSMLCGLACLLAVYAVYPQNGSAAGYITLPSLALIPVAIGLVAAWVWRPLKLSLGRTLLYSMVCFGASLAAAALIFREGLICVIILSPILLLGIVAGALTGRIWFRRDRTRVYLWVAPVFAGIVVAEPSWRDSHHSVVTDELRIAAPPARVWPHVLAFRPIVETPGYWLFRLGLPYPTETTNGGDFVGADRACRFSGDAVFKERIVEFAPPQRLTFDILESPPEPELLGHLEAYRGQFELRANADGTSTLLGRTWYSLQVRPAFYFDWWTHAIFSEVHLRVMRNVKRLTEIEAEAARTAGPIAEGAQGVRR